MHVLICYNPFSGKQKFEKELPYIIKTLKTKYEEVDVFRSLEVKSITQYITNFGKKYNLVIIAGGDGSLNEAINGLMKLENRPKLAYIPMGTVNDVGHLLKLKKNIKGVMKIILQDHTEKMDICRINEKYFVYACAVGNFTNVSYEAKSKTKKHFGALAYFLEAAKELKQDETINLKIETSEKCISGKYYVMLALNSKRLAGFRIHRDIKPKLNDGVIDLTLISKLKFRMSVFRLAFFFLFGERIQHGIENIRMSKVKVISDKELSFNVDGEFAFKANTVEIEVCKEAVEIIVNKKVQRKYF